MNEPEPVTYQCLGCERACAVAYTPLARDNDTSTIPSVCIINLELCNWELIRVGEVD